MNIVNYVLKTGPIGITSDIIKRGVNDNCFSPFKYKGNKKLFQIEPNI